MPYTPIYSPTAQIHDAIITQLKNDANVTAAIAAARIGTLWDNKQALTPTDVRVWAEEDGEETEGVYGKCFTFTLIIQVLTAHDIPASEIQSPLVTPHDVHESICGAIWYKYMNGITTFPTVTSLTPSGASVYLGKQGGSDDRGWFVDQFAWTLPYGVTL